MHSLSTRAATIGLASILATTAGSAVAQQAQQPPGFSPMTLDKGHYSFPTGEGFAIGVDVVVRGLDHPFSLAFLPDGDALVTERGKTLRLIHGATGKAGLDPTPVAGTPPVSNVRGAGLAEVALHPDFATNRLVYFTYNRPGTPSPDAAPGARPPTALVVARGRLDGMRLADVEDLYAATEHPGASGSRLAFDGNGHLFVTTGGPFGPEGQQLDSPYGKVLRLTETGGIPGDNPFVGQEGARGEIYSLGHRDHLGLTFDAATGKLYNAEHGPNGGDEINEILPGRDYGWPTYSFGRDYDGTRISDRPLGPDTEQPVVLWIPSIGITGLTIYTGDGIPEWRGNLFVGSARHGEMPGTGGLERVVMNDDFGEIRRESLLGPLHLRIRDVRQGPDGLLYLLTDEDDGALLRLSPDR